MLVRSQRTSEGKRKRTRFNLHGKGNITGSDIINCQNLCSIIQIPSYIAYISVFKVLYSSVCISNVMA